MTQNIGHVLFKTLSVNGYMVWQHEEKYGDEFYEKVPHLIANDDIQLREQIYKGLEEAPRAVYEVQKGLNTGKAIVLVAEDWLTFIGNYSPSHHVY